MHYKNNIKDLIKLRKDLLEFRNKEKKDISEILSWRKKLLKQSKIKARLININQCKCSNNYIGYSCSRGIFCFN
jgi:hypothetical protein